MELLAGFAFLAGLVTVASPCVLPVLPVILSSTVSGGRLRPLGVISGFLLSFTALTLALTAAVRAFHIDPEILRWAAAGIIIAFASVLVVPALKDRFMLAAGRLVPRAGAAPIGRPSPGFGAGLLTGASLGAVWTPCVGPIMASVITLAITQAVDLGAFIITIAYALGNAIPLLAVMLGGRALLRKFPGLMRRLSGLQRVFGVLMLGTGIAILTGWDRNIQSLLLETFPGYGSGLTSIEDNPAVRRAIEERAAGAKKSERPDGPIDFQGADPLARTSGRWFNSQPLTLAGLKGKVVLVDFWTYSCINCLRTLPYLAAWHERYGGEGLVIVGVHSPEFAFEREAGNLERAMRSLGVSWPVVQDNDFGIWNAFSNRYWPAHYLFDRSGQLAQTHSGEGAYEETERLIRMLVGRPAGFTPGFAPSAAADGPERNPETYLGGARSERQTRQEKDSLGNYALPDRLGRYEWGLAGRWRQTPEYIEAEGKALLSLDFHAKEVFLVLAPAADGPAGIAVKVDGQPVETDDVVGGVLSPRESRLYRLFSSPVPVERTLTLEVAGPLRLFTFTFS